MTLVKYILKKFVPLFVGSLCFFAFVVVLVDLFMNISTYLQNGSEAKDILTVMLCCVFKLHISRLNILHIFTRHYLI